MNAEMMGVNIVRLAIAKTDFLIPHINDNDREPSWDGDVEVYRKAGNTHAKADLVMKVPVQVKGHVASNLKKQTISYPVELSDLRNYLNAGGTTFLVVYVDSEGEKSQIYYNSLLPYDLKKIISKHGEQKNKNLNLKALPKDKRGIADVFLSAAMHMKKQRPAITCDPISMEDLIKDGRIPELSFGYTRVPDAETDPIDYMFDHGTYIYAKLPFGLELPVEHLSHIEFAGTTIDAPVCAAGRVFYSQYDILQSKNTVEYQLGKSTKLVVDRKSGKRRFTYCEEGTLSERITDADFILQAVEARQFMVGTNVYPMDAIKDEEVEAFNIPERKRHLEWLKTVKGMFEKLGVLDELDCDVITDVEEKMVQKLVLSVVHGKSVQWPDLQTNFPDITIANLTLKLCVIKDENNEGYYRVFEYSDAPVGFVMKDPSGQGTEVSYHVFLKRESMLNCCNINFSAVVRRLKLIPTTNEHSSALVWLLLEMLCAYDQSDGKRRDILDAAIELSDWLRHSDPFTPQDLLDLNHYQAVKRARGLTAREIQGLHSIIESKPERKDIYVGAYLILGDQISAKYYYDQMEEEEQNVFKSYPISHFLQTEE